MKSNYTEKKDTDSPITVEYGYKKGKGVAVSMEVDKDKVLDNANFKKIADTIISHCLSHSLALWIDYHGREPNCKEDADQIVDAAVKEAKGNILGVVRDAAEKHLALDVLTKDNMHENFNRAKKIMANVLKLQQEGGK